MITQELSPHKEVSRVHHHGKPKVVVGGDEHKKHIFERTMESIYNKPDMYDYNKEFKVKGYRGTSIIVNFAPFEECGWDGLKCLPIEIWCATENDMCLVHPSDLKPV